MNLRTVETHVAKLTLVWVALYLPLETWASLPDLASPYYIVDLVGIALMTWGALLSLAQRPRPAPALLCAGFAWCAANGWRATADRWTRMTDYPSDAMASIELWVVAGSTLAAGVVLLLLIGLCTKATAQTHDG